MRLKLSTTRKPSPAGVPTSSLQLLVPRSSAAKVGAGGPGDPLGACAELSTMAEDFRNLEWRIVLGLGRRFKPDFAPATVPARRRGRQCEEFDNLPAGT